MSNSSISFTRHVQQRLTPYRLGISIAVSVLASILFAVLNLASRASSDQQVLAALSPYLATLVESGDRPEILRVLHGVVESRKSDLILVLDEETFASTRDISEMDQPFIDPKAFVGFWGSRFTSSEIVSSLPVVRQGGPLQNAKIYSFSPLGPVLWNTLGLSVLTFTVSLLISYLSARQMESAIKTALRPLDQLRREIQGLSLEEESASDPIPIRELEDIRKTISITKRDLANARERLAEERAKQLSADSYRKLIHDLHNPVAALRRMAGLSTDPESDEATQQEAQESVARIADQILNQVSAAKANLDHQPTSLHESDLRDCVQESARQLGCLNPEQESNRVSLVLPEHPVIVAHDPLLLQRAVLNLLENGIEASRERVELKVEQADGRAFIRVSDDGGGMDETQITLYFQGRGRSKKANRQALGLSSANHIVRTHGGKLVYGRSQWGGASFEIRLEVST